MQVPSQFESTPLTEAEYHNWLRIVDRYINEQWEVMAAVKQADDYVLARRLRQPPKPPIAEEQIVP